MPVSLSIVKEYAEQVAKSLNSVNITEGIEMVKKVLQMMHC